jgi:Sulfotransferase family
MFSAIDHQHSMERVSKMAFFFTVITRLLAFSKLRCSLVVRDPYLRTASFYKDKFLRADDYRLWMKEQGFDQGWQQSTQLFFPYLGLSTQMDAKEVSEKLSKVSFEQFIGLLPKVYLQDGHLTPQYLAASMSFFRLGYRISFQLPLRLERIYKMESENDLKFLAKDFQLELDTKVNATEKMGGTITWSPFTRKTVERLYKRDFERFGYNVSS